MSIEVTEESKAFMALQGKDAAFVAAQLTTAWATLYATNPGTGGLSEHEIRSAVATTYDVFTAAVLKAELGSLTAQSS